MNKLTVKFTLWETILGWFYMAFQLVILPVILVFANMLIFRERLTDTQINFAYFLVNFLFVIAIFHKSLIACCKISLAKPWKTISSAIWAFFLYWGMSIFISSLILLLYPDFNNVNDAAIQEMADNNFILTAVGVVLLVPIAEEFFYRGLIFQGLYRKNRVLAYAVSAIAFCAPHVIGYIGQYGAFHLILCFIQYLPAGIFLAWAYEKADSIIAPIIMHTLINLIAAGAMFVR
ncbi:MAG: CPBP family intramembrane metalloprotease [Oscillospiraceae bacterium]|nr:CPBP family intramembrane metalloprotease [Oscillospiraceae bacterium]